MAEFGAAIARAYTTEGAVLDLGRGVPDGALEPQAAVKAPLRMVNRHGLVAGATGTGETKTLQTLVEQLSAAGVPVFVADVKGDVSGLAARAGRWRGREAPRCCRGAGGAGGVRGGRRGARPASSWIVAANAPGA
jgi:hypothetical protein